MAEHGHGGGHAPAAAPAAAKSGGASMPAFLSKAIYFVGGLVLLMIFIIGFISVLSKYVQLPNMPNMQFQPGGRAGSAPNTIVLPRRPPAEFKRHCEQELGGEVGINPYTHRETCIVVK